MKVIATLFLLAITTTSLAGEVQSPDALEKELSACLIKGAKSSKCAETILGGRILPGNEGLQAVAAQIDELLKTWLGGDSVYAVHLIRTIKAGQIYEKRVYLLEDTAGNFMALNTSVIKHLGKWYVMKFNVNSKAEAIEAVLAGTP